MVTELEKHFFSTFGIEPKPLFSTRNGYTDDAYLYPEITDRILFELICMNPLCVEFKDISELKNIIIKYFIDNLKSYAELSEAEIFKQQVQALFKEE